MGKWLAALGVVVIVILVLLWRELDSSSAAPAEAAKPALPTEIARAPAPKPEVKPAEPAPAAQPAPAAEPDRSKEKMDPQSDEFFREHDEVVTKKLMNQAVKCWESLPAAKREGFHRNLYMKAKYKQKIRNGVVTIEDLEVTESTLGDAALQACFVQQLRGTTWKNDRLPDWDQDDEIKLGPRTLKKYTRENVDYVGPEAPPIEAR
jgi:hypothetical protein